MARPVGTKNIKWDKDELQRLYWDERMSCRAIADQYKTVSQAVLKALQKFGIPRRTISEATQGSASYRWKGDNYKYKDYNGYIQIRCPNHPHASKKGGYVFEHRLTVERKMGRVLESSEIVHHLNGVYDDNREENLIVFSKKTHDNLIPALQKRIRELEGYIKERNKQSVMDLKV